MRWKAVLRNRNDRLKQVGPRQRAVALVQQLQAPQLQWHSDGQAPRDGCRRIACGGGTLSFQI